MTNAELIQKIRAEIERRIEILADVSLKQQKKGDEEMSNYYHGKAVALEELLSFLDTLESEKPMNQEELEKELDRYLHGEFQQTAGGNFNNYLQVARHFAKWGAEHLKK